MHDPRIGRFFAVDLLSPKYPWYTPYQFSGNKVIDHVELEGLEEAPYQGQEKIENGVKRVYMEAAPGSNKYSAWIKVPTEEELDRIQSNIYKGIETVRNTKGGKEAADNLERYMKGTGDISVNMAWLNQFDHFKDAKRRTIHHQFFGENSKTGKSLLDKMSEMKDGSTMEHEDFWEAAVEFSLAERMAYSKGYVGERSLYFAWGGSTLTSKFDIKITRNGNVYEITGTFQIDWSDKYDWHYGLGVQIPGAGGVDDKDLILMELYRGAVPFEGTASSTFEVNMTMDADTGTSTINSFVEIEN
jgi:hypothetical protein